MSTTFKKIIVAAVSAAVLGGAGCAQLNPAKSVTIDADPDAGATKEILANFPEAKHIKVTHAEDNPNIMTWNMPDGKVCTASASQTQFKTGTPGQLIAEPYCRLAI